MKTNFFNFWVRNTKTSFLFIALIVFAGLFSLMTIPKESSPDIKFGIISITTAYPGVNPEDIDSLITEKVEREIENLDGIKKITSTSSVGFSNTTVELYNGVNTREVLTDIKDKIDNLDLPEDALDPSVVEVSSNNELMFEVLLYGDAEEYDNFSLMTKAKRIQNKLEGKYGITSIDIGGLDNRNWSNASSSASDYKIKVLLDKQKVELLGLSIHGVGSQIQAFNKNTPIGNFRVGDLNYDFRFDGELTNIEELKQVVIRDTGTSKILLSDITTITREYADTKVRRLGFYNETGYNYVSLIFNKKNGANIFSVADEAKAGLEQLLHAEEFQDLGVKYSKDMSELIIEDYKNLGQTGVTTLILVFFTILFFVGIRESIIASLLLPLAFLITFITLDTLGYSLNFLTNFSLVLTLGIAIDTVIVIVEGANERMKLGYHRTSAILIAIRDFKAPLISGTMTTLVAFLPMMFLPGVVGKFLAYIPITVFTTLLAALFLSLTLSSALFVKLAKHYGFYRRDKKVESKLSLKDREQLEIDREGKLEKPAEEYTLREKLLYRLESLYSALLHGTMYNKKRILAFVFAPVLILILTFVFLAPRIGFTLFPNTDEGVINIDIASRPGSDEDVLTQYLTTIDAAVSKYEELKVYYTTISGNSLTVYIDLIDKLERQDRGMRDVFAIEKMISADLDTLRSYGLEVEVGTLKNGPPSGKPVGIKLIADSAQDFDTLKQVSHVFKEELRTIPGAKNVGTSSSETPGQFVFQFNRPKLSYLGLTPNDILGEVYYYTNGLKAGSINSDYEDNEIVLSFAQFDEYLSPRDIEDLVVNTKIGKLRVGDFSSVQFLESVSAITREDGKIIIRVESDVESDYLPTQIQPALEAFAEQYEYPEGVSFSAGGETDENADLILSTIKSFVIAIFLIFSILVFQFNSYLQPLIVLYSVVLALLGVNIGLFLTGNPYSMPFGIGFIALTGVVVNDAIILIDRMNKTIKNAERHSKKPLKYEDYVEQVIVAAKSRLQPVIVTTLTTVFGVLPLAMQDEFWAGLGYTIVFGLFVGSFMTLMVIPMLYKSLVLKTVVK